MQGKGLYIIATIIGVAILGGAVWTAYDAGGPASGSGGSSTTALINPDDTVQVARGEKIYAEACAACHGANLEGQPNWKERNADGSLPAPPHDDSGHTWHHADDFLFGYTKFGGQAYAPEGFTSGMPGFEEQYADEDILAVFAFIKTKWSKESRAQQARISAQAR